MTANLFQNRNLHFVEYREKSVCSNLLLLRIGSGTQTTVNLPHVPKNRKGRPYGMFSPQISLLFSMHSQSWYVIAIVVVVACCLLLLLLVYVVVVKVTFERKLFVACCSCLLFLMLLLLLLLLFFIVCCCCCCCCCLKLLTINFTFVCSYLWHMWLCC